MSLPVPFYICHGWLLSIIYHFGFPFIIVRLFESDHNKKLIETIIREKKELFEKIFNLTFIECVEHFIGEKEIEELRGLRLFSELKNEIIDKYKTDGESYYENLKLFLKEFENKINKVKSRKKRKKNN